VIDVAALFAVQKEASLVGFAHIYPAEKHPFPDEAVRSGLAAQVGEPRVVVLTDEREGRLLGFALLGESELHRLYVLPEAWGCGVAQRLHDEAVACWRERGDAEAFLWVLEENRRARRFYERNGWEPTGERATTPAPPHPIKLRYRLRLTGA